MVFLQTEQSRQFSGRLGKGILVNFFPSQMSIFQHQGTDCEIETPPSWKWVTN